MGSYATAHLIYGVPLGGPEQWLMDNLVDEDGNPDVFGSLPDLPWLTGDHEDPHSDAKGFGDQAEAALLAAHGFTEQEPPYLHPEMRPDHIDEERWAEMRAASSEAMRAYSVRRNQAADEVAVRILRIAHLDEPPNYWLAGWHREGSISGARIVTPSPATQASCHGRLIKALDTLALRPSRQIGYWLAADYA
jgi:hypothetical protein